MHVTHDTVDKIDTFAEYYLQRTGRHDLVDYLSGWLMSETKSPDSLKLMYIGSFCEDVSNFPLVVGLSTSD